MSLTRKGDRADTALSGKRDPELCAALDDLVQLAELNALAGVAEIIRERLRQITVLAHTLELHDVQYADGSLVALAAEHLMGVDRSRAAGVADPAYDESGLRWSGALVAAEIDRLNRMVTPEEPMVTKTGRVLTEADLDQLVAEAEQGYDIPGVGDGA